MNIKIPIRLNARGTGKINNHAVGLVRCRFSDVCLVDCPHRDPHPRMKLEDGYRCDQYKRKDISEKRCGNESIVGAYCVRVN